MLQGAQHFKGTYRKGFGGPMNPWTWS